MLTGCFTEAAREFQDYFKGVEKEVSKVSQASFKGVSRMSQWSFKNVLGYLQRVSIKF